MTLGPASVIGSPPVPTSVVSRAISRAASTRTNSGEKMATLVRASLSSSVSWTMIRTRLKLCRSTTDTASLREFDNGM